MRTQVDVEELIGKVMTEVRISGREDGDEKVIFCTNTGEVYHMFHVQDCCEGVYIDDVCGNLDDLIGVPILIATEDSNGDDDRPEGDTSESYTWTFYNFRTNRGAVTIRWFGGSNGYYSEDANLYRIEPNPEVN